MRAKHQSQDKEDEEERGKEGRSSQHDHHSVPSLRNALQEKLRREEGDEGRRTRERVSRSAAIVSASLLDTKRKGNSIQFRYLALASCNLSLLSS